jgi:glutathione synthase
MLKIAVQMDHIAGIKILGDSTFGLMLEAQARRHGLYHYTPNDLFMRDGVVFAHVQSVKVQDEQGKHFELGEKQTIQLQTMDVVLLRQDPPFDMNYITTTHFLERLHPKTLVVNDPAHVRNAPEKIMVTLFPDLMPETLITRNREDIESFRREFKDIVMKPLYGNGGAGVFRVRADDENFGALYEMFSASAREPWMIQPYLPAVREGDKRIILVDGEFRGALNRVPAQGDLRANLVRGGAGETAQITAREEEICERLKPELQKRGLIFTGIDVIGGFLTEINVTSPTGLRAIKRLGGRDIAKDIWDVVEGKRR